MTKTTNEMIFATLKTKGCKEAKYAEQLRELGYEVSNLDVAWDGAEYVREHWAVNGIELVYPDRGAVYVSLGRGQCIDRLDAIKLVDFVDYFAKKAERDEKRRAMNSDGDITDDRVYHVKKRDVYVDADGHVHRWYERGCHKETRRLRSRSYVSKNSTISTYKAMKRKAQASGNMLYSGGEDYEIEFAKRMQADAEKRVEELRKQLEAAERAVERRKADVQREVEKKQEGGRELDAWLKAKGIR